MRILRAAALAAMIALPSGAAIAQTKITVGKIVGGIGLHIPSYIAMDRGFFKAGIRLFRSWKAPPL